MRHTGTSGCVYVPTLAELGSVAKAFVPSEVWSDELLQLVRC